MLMCCYGFLLYMYKLIFKYLNTICCFVHNFNYDCLKMLLRGLRDNCHITLLDLSNNKITAEGAKLLA